MKPVCFPIIDNGMGLSVTAWAVALAAARPPESLFIQISSPYPDYAMNLAVHRFLQSECDEMIVIDTDLVFTPQHLQCLMEHDEPLVFGLYCKRKLGFELPMVPLPENPRPFDAPGPLCEVARTARGFMRVHRSVFEKLAPHVRLQETSAHGPFRQYFTLSPDGTSEDFAFCDLWRQHGGRVLVDKRILALHAGQVLYPVVQAGRQKDKG